MQNLAVDLHSLLQVGQFLVVSWAEGADHDPDVGIGAGSGTEGYDDTEDNEDDRLGREGAGVVAATITFVPQCRQNF